MTKYIIIYNNVGRILRTISCPADHVALQRLRPGETMLEGKADGITQKIVNGRIVDKTPAELNALKMKNKKLRLRFK